MQYDNNDINQGKRDWLKVINKKHKMNEEQDVMGGSDISAHQPTASGYKPQTMDNVQQTVSDAGESREFKDIKKNLLLAITSAKRSAVTKLARLFPRPFKMPLPELIENMEELRTEYVAENEKLIPQMVQNIKQYNEIVETAVKHTLGTMGLAVDRMKLPETINSLDDYKNMALFYGMFENVVGDVARDAQNMVKKQIGNNVLGASLVNEAFAGRRNVPEVDDPISTLAKVKQRIPHKYSQVIRQSGLSKKLANTLILTAKHEVINAIIKGLTEKIQRLQASAKAQDAKKALHDAELVVLDPNDFGVSPDESADALDETQIITTGHGPGKVVDASLIKPTESRATERVSLKENWKKYSDKNKNLKNTEKPDDFTLMMG